MADALSDYGHMLSDAFDPHERLKGISKDRVFVRAEERNIGYFIRVLRERSIMAYCSANADQFRHRLFG